ncbi:MAG: hypothetical protein LBL40_00085 [Coxiellaceae bacterium]|jgi:hypothetical protein|nr:hypothetical protein [Coxiellaceae bacterium]
MAANLGDFTKIDYRRLLEIAKSKFEFIFFDEADSIKKQSVLWRHDVDFSVEKALEIASLDASMSVYSTNFILLHSPMYSLFEKKTFMQIREILSLNHRIGLHFDISFYDINNYDDLEKYLIFEKNILENLFEVPIKYISFHNPQYDHQVVNLEQEMFCNMINTYSLSLKKRYEYVSDSNGYWRYKTAYNVLSDSDRSVQVLTHPIWWCDGLSPRDKIQRCVDRRSLIAIYDYDNYFIMNPERLNVR